MTAGSQCSGDNTTECQCGTECLPWTPGGGSWHCLYSPPLTEEAACDYGQRIQLCEEGLDCTDGLCQGIITLRWLQNIENIAGIPLGSECWSQTIGAATQRCSSGTECLPWTPGGGSWDGTSPLYCLYPQPLAHLESCNYTEKRQLCDTGLMCEQGVCVRADKYKWDKININDQGFR